MPSLIFEKKFIFWRYEALIPFMISAGSYGHVNAADRRCFPEGTVLFQDPCTCCYRSYILSLFIAHVYWGKYGFWL
jgi:hypothetical protein